MMGTKSDIRTEIHAHRGLVAITVAFIVGWTVYGFVIGSKATIAYLATVIILFSVVAAVHVRVRFSRTVLRAFCVWGFVHMAGGLVPVGSGVLYNISLGLPLIHYDRIVHAFGFGFAAVACWQGLCAALGKTPRVGMGLASLVALMGMGLGALNEVFEFFASQWFAANVGGYENTGWDLVFNTIGCTVAAFWIAQKNRATQAVKWSERR
jgi:hypothetical protein